ncbi:MAG: nuclear transport factor 2 family protein [Halioglobus sp.]|nr:nuclear transport factor 2 family protein [Halioglobus sp.]
MVSTEKALLIRNALIDSYNNYAEGLDSKNWLMVRDCFADEVYIDYGEISAATGAPHIPRAADDWIEQLKSVINGFDVTRHAITNHRVLLKDTVVSCRAYLSADHVLYSHADNHVVDDDQIVTVVGEYTNDYQLCGGQWKICKSVLVVNWSRGNMALFTTAPKRAARYQT